MCGCARRVPWLHLLAEDELQGGRERGVGSYTGDDDIDERFEGAPVVRTRVIEVDLDGVVD